MYNNITTTLHKEQRPRSESNSSLDNTSSLTDEVSTKSLPSRAGISYVITISPHFILLTLVIVCVAAFAVGTISRIMLLSSMGIHPSAYPLNSSIPILQCNTTTKHEVQLPTPVRINDKVPSTMYTSTQLLPLLAAKTSHSVHMDRNVKLSDTGDNISNDENTNHVHQHLPSGQHVLVDLKNVDPVFLNSEERLAEALVQLAIISKVNLLSYHCHSLVPMGVSCVGILLESHVS